MKRSLANILHDNKQHSISLENVCKLIDRFELELLPYAVISLSLPNGL